MEIQSVSGLCHGFIKSPGARISLCSFLSVNSIICEHFPCHVCPQGGPPCCSLAFMCMPGAGHSPAQGDRGRLSWNWGAWISIFHFLQHGAEFLLPSEIKITLIRLFLFCNTFFLCCMIPSSCLELNHNELSPCFQSSILWGKRKQGNHIAGTRASFFFFS